MPKAANNLYRFTITKPGVVPGLVKALVALALRETDLVYGPARRKIETQIQVSRTNRACSIAGGTECGEHLARLLCGFLMKQLGESGFRVRRSERQLPSGNGVSR
jgi:hypothetical protein